MRAKVVPFDPAKDIAVIEWENGKRSLVVAHLLSFPLINSPEDVQAAAEKAVQTINESKADYSKWRSYMRGLLG